MESTSPNKSLPWDATVLHMAAFKQSADYLGGGVTMGRMERIINKIHRISAALLLVSMIPAGYASFKGDVESPLVYLPLPFLFALIITGTYQLILPWVRRYRVRKAAGG